MGRLKKHKWVCWAPKVEGAEGDVIIEASAAHVAKQLFAIDFDCKVSEVKVAKYVGSYKFERAKDDA